jgi:hypothetical protein
MESRLSPVLLTLTFITTGVLGCQTLPGKQIDRVLHGDELQGTFTQPGFDDIELPRGLTYQPKPSTILDSEQHAYGEIHFKGRLQGLALADFLSNHMPQRGWRTMSRVHLEHHILFFEKESRLCVATIDEGPITTHLVLLVVPRSTPRAAATLAPTPPMTPPEQPSDSLDTVPLFPEDDPWN